MTIFRISYKKTVHYKQLWEYETGKEIPTSDQFGGRHFKKWKQWHSAKGQLHDFQFASLVKSERHARRHSYGKALGGKRIAMTSETFGPKQRGHSWGERLRNAAEHQLGAAPTRHLAARREDARSCDSHTPACRPRRRNRRSSSRRGKPVVEKQRVRNVLISWNKSEHFEFTFVRYICVISHTSAFEKRTISAFLTIVVSQVKNAKIPLFGKGIKDDVGELATAQCPLSVSGWLRCRKLMLRKRNTSKWDKSTKRANLFKSQRQ